MAPALVIASACGSARVWEADCIAQEFLRKGALAYVGATSIAWGSSDEFRQQMFNQLSDGRLHIGRAFKFAVDNLDQNDLWAKRFGEGNDFANMTRYEMNLFGLASTEIDPGDGVEQRVSYGSPVYDSVSKTWSVDATFDIPAPVELTDAEENVTDIVMPCDLLPYFSDGGDYPALSLIPFEYQLPVGGSLVGVAQTEAVVYDSYGFSLPKLADYPMWPPDGEEYADAPQAPDEEPELYDGALFPDVLFVSDSEHDAVSNSDRVFGSVSAYQVDGTVPETTVYDSVVLRLAYTTPLGLEETHVVSGANITVEATIFSADGDPHTVRPVVRVETLGGLLYEEQTGADLSVNATPRVVDFHVSDIVPRTYVVRITVTEADVPVAELSFQESQPGASVSGVIGEANCEALEGATVKLLRDSTEVASVASGAGGTYELTAPEVGTYSLVASAAGFKEEAQAIEVSDIETDYGVDFQGNTGLVPAAATMSYVLECVNHWLFPPDEDCGLSMSTVLAVVNAWLYPT